jgi:hypothetical protein
MWARLIKKRTSKTSLDCPTNCPTNSVLLWAPIWTQCYHVTTGIKLSSETLAVFGELSDEISIYSANLITSGLNYMHAVYSWIQLLIRGGFTGSVLWFARPILSDSEVESAPDFVGEASGQAICPVSIIIDSESTSAHTV